MKIFPINLIKAQSIQRRNLENNHTDYSQNSLSVPAPLRQDTCTFTAKIPSIMAPTMEDLINKTKAIDVMRFNILRLAEYDIPCPVCGHLMLSVNKYNAFEEQVLNAADTGELLDCIGSLKKYLHPVERKMYSIFREKHAKNPNLTLHQMLREMLPVSEPKIVHRQMEIFSNIGLLSRELPKDKQKKVNALLQETFSRIMDPRETSRFSRRIFIDKLEKELFDAEQIDIFLSHLPPEKREYFRELYNPMDFAPRNIQQIIEEATNLPTAYNNLDAFVVKYAKRNYNGANPDKRITLRMLSNSLVTIEHIKAQKMRGGTEPKNLALECACDNNRRGHKPILQQIIENPQMTYNYPKYMERLCEIHLMNKVEKSYISQQNNTFSEASYAILDADLSSIRKPVRKIRQKNSETVTKEERRAQRKAAVKAKKAAKNSAVKKNGSKGYRR